MSWDDGEPEPFWVELACLFLGVICIGVLVWAVSLL